tara:strand:+ start:278 stop:2773 length:2496 start_codon:yes stop_codon:yes gene_type:complete
MGRAVHPHIITPDSALGGFDIKRSVRCGGGGNFTRTPSVTGNQKVWTWSAWIKKWYANGGTHYLFTSEGSNDGIAGLYFSGDNLHTYFDTSGANPYGAVNSRKYRDSNSWMHIVWQVDATNTTQRIWVNGQEESLTSSNNPPNYAYSMNQSGKLQGLGVSAFGGSHTNGLYFAEVHHSDGYKYDPSYYGYTDSQTGIWRPKKVTGISYGVNGFYLDFSDNSATTAAALGKDRSGNGNDWTPNGMSIANNSANDSLFDTPTNNFCTFDALSARGTTFMEPNEGGLGFSLAAHTDVMSSFLIPDSGKWYAEFVFTTVASGAVGVTNLNRKQTSGAANALNGINMLSGEIRVNDSTVQSGLTAIGANDVIGIKVDRDAGTVQFTNDGVNVGTPVLISSMNAPFDLMFNTYRNSSGGSTPSGYVNFGQRTFSYLPSGFRSLCSRNMTTPTGSSIVDPKKHFDILQYTTGSSNGTFTHTGVGFKPDLMWVKCQTAGEHHFWIDSVRGDQAITDKFIRSSDAGAEGTAGTSGTTWTTINGGLKVTETSIDNSSGGGELYYASRTYVSWCWKAGGSSNTYNIDGKGYATATAAGLDGGTKNPTGASVNTKAGFSIISYVASNGTNDTIYHGLKQAPEIIITKDRDNSRSWGLYHSLNGGTNTNWIAFNDNNSQGTNDSGETLGGVSGSYMYLHEDYFQPAHGSYANGGDDGADKIIAYMWHSVPGYSKMGIYKGNGNANGVYVPLGFRPAWVMVRRTDGGNNWIIYDNKRSTTNVIDNYLVANGTDVDNTNAASNIDFLHDGFKFRSGYDMVNAGDYIYMAFAEQVNDTPYMAPTNAR